MTPARLEPAAPRSRIIFLVKARPRSEYARKRTNITKILAKVKQSQVSVGRLYEVGHVHSIGQIIVYVFLLYFNGKK